MPSHWVHFIGKSYYSPTSFIKEAKQFGASRKVSPRLVKVFSWGDTIWCCQGDMVKKTRKIVVQPTEIFGSFKIDRLSGLTVVDIEALETLFDLEHLRDGDANNFVTRGCGEYLEGSTYTVRGAPLNEIIVALLESDHDGQRTFLLQGKFTELKPHAFLTDIHFRWGFRRFDYPTFKVEYDKSIERGIDPIVLAGEYRVEGEYAKSSVKRAELQVLLDYNQFDLYSTTPSITI